MSEGPIDALLELVRQAQVTKYTYAISVVLFAWDHFLTLGDEVSVIWPASWGAGKILFLAARYLTWPELVLEMFGKAVNLTPAQYSMIAAYAAASSTACIVAVQWILILRTWAIWDGRYSILFVLSAINVGTTAAGAYIAAKFVLGTNIVSTASFAHVLTGGVTIAAPRSLWLATVPTFGFDLVTLVFMTAKLRRRYFPGDPSSPPLLYHLHCDGFLYFLGLAAVCLTNIVLLKTSSAEFARFAAEFQRVMHSILCCRLVLHLQKVARLSLGGSETSSEVLFAYKSSLLDRGRVRLGGRGRSLRSGMSGSRWSA